MVVGQISQKVVSELSISSMLKAVVKISRKKRGGLGIIRIFFYYIVNKELICKNTPKIISLQHGNEIIHI